MTVVTVPILAIVVTVVTKKMLSQNSMLIPYLKLWQLKNSNCDKTQNSNCDKTQILKFWQNSVYEITLKLYLVRTTWHLDNWWNILKATFYNLTIYHYSALLLNLGNIIFVEHWVLGKLKVERVQFIRKFIWHFNFTFLFQEKNFLLSALYKALNRPWNWS